jgi:O-glycosyl hydrolase
MPSAAFPVPEGIGDLLSSFDQAPLTNINQEKCTMKPLNQVFRSLACRPVVIAVMAISFAPTAFAQTTGTVNFGAKQQQIDGFGVAATFGRPGFIQTATGTLPKQIVDLLFNPKTGAGMSMLRFGIDDVVTPNPISVSSAAGVANSGIFIVNTPPNSCSVTPTYTWDHSAGGEVWLGQQALKYGVNRFFADSWGAPA